MINTTVLVFVAGSLMGFSRICSSPEMVIFGRFITGIHSGTQTHEPAHSHTKLCIHCTYKSCTHVSLWTIGHVNYMAKGFRTPLFQLRECPFSCFEHTPVHKASSFSQFGVEEHDWSAQSFDFNFI